jgi:hypothetical protein
MFGFAVANDRGYQMTVSSETLHPISAHDRVDSRLGTLEFVDGFPSPTTRALVYGQPDSVHGRERVSQTGTRRASTYALHTARRRGRTTMRS